MKKEDIEEINSRCIKDLYDIYEGILVEPQGIPIDIKKPVVYMRWTRGRWCGAGYHEDSCLRYESFHDRKPNKFTILDLICEKLSYIPTYSFFKEVEALFKNEWTDGDRDYYGNGDEYEIDYLILEDLENLIKYEKNKQQNIN